MLSHSLTSAACMSLFLQTGATALMWAARNGRADVAEALVVAGADTNARDKVSLIQTCVG